MLQENEKNLKWFSLYQNILPRMLQKCEKTWNGFPCIKIFCWECCRKVRKPQTDFPVLKYFAGNGFPLYQSCHRNGRNCGSSYEAACPHERTNRQHQQNPTEPKGPAPPQCPIGTLFNPKQLSPSQISGDLRCLQLSLEQVRIALHALLAARNLAFSVIQLNFALLTFFEHEVACILNSESAGWPGLEYYKYIPPKPHKNDC